MKRYFYAPLLLATLVGCSSSSNTPQANQYAYYSGGQSIGDSTSFYWFTKRLGSAYSAADYVTSGDYGYYRTDYAWQGDVLRELIREGYRTNDEQELVPYRVHLRFSASGEAVYQQLRLDGKVLPIPEKQIKRYQQEANFVVETTEAQDKENLELVQGYWDGETFETCDDREYEKLAFNQTLPSFVVNRLSTVDSYVAFIGQKELKTLSVSDLLMLSEDNQDCIKRPSFIEQN
ncbi:DUF1481 domain-containing protein [Vibrio sp. vnigr-6D03]|uniref:Peptidyl-prolyl cis-trans isomerase n=1 Tax=Vibrio penaeicida TaxID=104609 RepID=A0AAV5NSA6_9VIBR|nr:MULTISPECIES: DUF1481 domain-containing protein [Vibrio]PKF77725.1 DUF1481 domain-containing protein [Vibrio sp. vnigr-6D03]RTZ20986.1 DUF1481 domain-containing protein [Vibrio penaeicida]GLQ73199.1 peptidyl-prolyl cis-trans isomerase [Vibrio penaeicida]